MQLSSSSDSSSLDSESDKGSTLATTATVQQQAPIALSQQDLATSATAALQGAKSASPFALLDTRDAGSFHWAEGSDNKIIYQTFTDVVVALVALQDLLKKLPLDDKVLAASNEV